MSKEHQSKEKLKHKRRKKQKLRQLELDSRRPGRVDEKRLRQPLKAVCAAQARPYLVDHSTKSKKATKRKKKKTPFRGHFQPFLWSYLGPQHRHRVH